MELKKVLLFTGKFPSFGDDTDGGSILIYSLIQALKNNCILDVIFTRTPRKGFEVIEGPFDGLLDVLLLVLIDVAILFGLFYLIIDSPSV